MTPPIFAICSADVGVTALLGSSPCRLWPFGAAPVKTVPYAVWRTVFGAPENLLSEIPDVDTWGLQIDVYAETVTQAREIAEAIRDAIEPYAYVTSWHGDGRDPDTKNYTYSFDVDWIQSR